MNQEKIRSQIRDSRRWQVFKKFLDKSHEDGSHVHQVDISREIIVTNFIPADSGELKVKTRTIGRERI
jgi:hypothetical protein